MRFLFSFFFLSITSIVQKNILFIIHGFSKRMTWSYLNIHNNVSLVCQIFLNLTGLSLLFMRKKQTTTFADDPEDQRNYFENTHSSSIIAVVVLAVHIHNNLTGKHLIIDIFCVADPKSKNVSTSNIQPSAQSPKLSLHWSPNVN